MAGCAAKGPGPGAMLASVPVTEVPGQSFVKKWGVDVAVGKGGKLVHLYEAGDFLFAIDNHNFSTVIRKETGAVLAVDEIRTPSDILPPFTNGTLFCYPAGTELFFYDANGKLVRVVDTKNAIRGSGAFSDNTVYLGTTGINGGRLRAVDVNRIYGTAKWEILTGGAIISAPVFYDQQVFFATDDGKVYAIDENRNNTWALPKPYFESGPVTADLTVDEAALYVPSTDSKLTAIDRKTGRIKWQYFAGYPLYKAAIPVSDTVYVPIPGQGLAAVDKNASSYNRAARWMSRESTDFLADDGKYAYVRLNDNAIAALDRKTGAVAFRSGATPLSFFVTAKTPPSTAHSAANTPPGGTGKMAMSANATTMPSGTMGNGMMGTGMMGTVTAGNALIFAATKDGYVVAVNPVTRPGTMGQVLFTK